MEHSRVMSAFPFAGISPSQFPQQRKRSSVESPSEPDSGPIDNPRKAPKTNRACDHCRAKKSKCTGTRPCDLCKMKNMPCAFSGGFHRGKLAPTLPPLETFSDQLRREIAQSPSSTPRQANDANRQYSRESAAVIPAEDNNDDVPSRTSPELEMAEIEGQYCDPTSGLAFLHRAWERLSKEEVRSVPDGLDGTEKRQRLMSAGDKPLDTPDETNSGFPDKSTALELMVFYFDVSVVTYRFLHRETVFNWFDIVQANVQDDMPMQHKLGEAKAAIILTILAIVTLRKEKIKDSSGDQTWSLRWSDRLFRQATGLTDLETGLPRLESAQARLVQVLYLLQTSRMNQAWYVFGNTVQIILALGLHRRSVRKLNGSSSKNHPVDYINAQCRKRTFWVAYTIDKYLGFVFGRPRHFDDDDIDQDFPDRVNDEDMTQQGPSTAEPLQDCHVDSLIFHAKLAQIIGSISREVYSIKRVRKYDRVIAARRLGGELHRWSENLPPHLGTVRPHSLMPSFRREATALKLAYSHAIIHANRPFLLGATSGQNDIPVIRHSVSECISSAKVALETVDSMASDGTLFHAFWWTPYVTFCALAVVYVWEIQQNSAANGNGTSSSDDKESVKLSELAERCHTHLARATAADSPGRRYSVILEELRTEAKHQLDRSRRDRSAQVLQREATAALPEYMRNNAASGAALFGSSENPGIENNQLSMNNLLEEWQTNDWLDLDSSAFGLFPELDSPSALWPSNDP